MCNYVYFSLLHVVNSKGKIITQILSLVHLYLFLVQCFNVQIMIIIIRGSGKYTKQSIIHNNHNNNKISTTAAHTETLD